MQSMRPINIFALTRIDSESSQRRLERQMSGRSHFLMIKEWEVESLRKAIREAEKTYEKVDPGIRERWEREFLQPFQAKLAKKEKRLRKR